MSSSPLLTAAEICLAANSLVFTSGLYYLLHVPSPTDSSWATPKHQTKNLKTAIATTILAHSRPTAPESVSLHQRSQLEVQAQYLLQQAYDQAERRNFTNAVALLKQISPQTPTGAIHSKLVEYRRKQQIRANYLLQRAYDRAALSDFRTALRYLKQIPTHTAAYERAVIKVTEYVHKQHFQSKVQQTLLPIGVVHHNHRAATSTAFHPDSHLQEVNTNYSSHKLPVRTL